MKKSTNNFINILLALIPTIIVICLIIFDPLYSMDSLVCDKLYSQMNGAGNTIKIIGVDEKTLSKYGPYNTWSREKIAELIEKLYADTENTPSVLGVDFMFIGNSDDSIDSYLAKASEMAPHIVFASNLVYKGQTKHNAGGVIYYDKWNIESEEKPFDNLLKNSSIGFANTLLSKDGFLRTAQLFADINGEKRYSFATQVYLEYMDSINEVAVFPKTNELNQFQFFYSGKPGDFSKFSLCDVLEGNIPAEEFNNCIVMIGAYAPGFQDAYHTAAKRGGDMYGVEINANIVRALMQKKTASKVNTLIYLIIAALVIFIYTFFARQMKMYPALIVGFWILLAEGIIGRVLAVNGYVMSIIYIPIVLILVCLWIIIEKYVIEIVKKRRVLNSFRKYMAPQVIERMAKNGDFKIELGGEKRDVAVLFVDIRGFTTMSEILKPEEVVQILNQYLTLTTASIFANGGMLDKFVGDATMAVFNAPNDQDDYEIYAIKAALDMQHGGIELEKKLFEEYGRTVSFGIGINAGEAIVGNIGCETRMDYTAIGDTVNTAARLESRALKGEILISEEVYNRLKGRIIAEFKEEMSLKGKAETVKVYNVKGLTKEELL